MGAIPVQARPYRSNEDIVQRQIPGAPAVIKSAATVVGDTIDWAKAGIGSGLRQVAADYGTWGGLSKAVNRDANAIRRVAGVPERTSESLAIAAQDAMRRQFPGATVIDRILEKLPPAPAGAAAVPGAPPVAAALPVAAPPIAAPAPAVATAPLVAAPAPAVATAPPVVAVPPVAAAPPTALDLGTGSTLPPVPVEPTALAVSAYQKPANVALNFGGMGAVTSIADARKHGAFRTAYEKEQAESALARGEDPAKYTGDTGRYSPQMRDLLTSAAERAKNKLDPGSASVLTLGPPEQILDASGNLTPEAIKLANDRGRQEAYEVAKKEGALDLRRSQSGAYTEDFVGRHTGTVRNRNPQAVTAAFERFDSQFGAGNVDEQAKLKSAEKLQGAELLFKGDQAGLARANDRWMKMADLGSDEWITRYRETYNTSRADAENKSKELIAARDNTSRETVAKALNVSNEKQQRIAAGATVAAVGAGRPTAAERQETVTQNERESIRESLARLVGLYTKAEEAYTATDVPFDKSKRAIELSASMRNEQARLDKLNGVATADPLGMF